MGPESQNERWQHSVPLDSKYWINNPRYPCTIPPRISKYAQTSDDGLIQLHIDIVGKENIGVANGCLCRIGSFVSVAYAEAPPEVVALLGYCSELTVLFDDLDVLESDNLSVEATSSLLPTYYQHLDMKTEGPVWKARAKQTLSKVIVKFFEADPTLGKELFREFNAWRSGEKSVQKRFHEYKTLFEYGDDRNEDLGWPYVISCMRLGNNIHLTEEEEVSVKPVFLPLKYHSGFVNDYLSWEKEIKQYEMSDGKMPLVNAVALLMRWHGQSVTEAKESLRQTCLDLDSEYFRLKKEYFKVHGDTMSSNLRRWFDLFEVVISGNLWWLMMSYRHDISPDGSGYRDYYNKRCSEGAIWPDDCTQTEGVLSGGIELRFKDQQPDQEVQPQLKVKSSMTEAKQSDTKSVHHNGVQPGLKKLRKYEKTHSRNVSFTDPSLLIRLDDTLVNLPVNYIFSLPSKGIRGLAIDALNTWYQAPNKTLKIVKETIDVLHNSSLMFDDIEDHSKLRRGKPATHMVFGPEQTINSASFLIVRGLELVNQLSASSVTIYAEELRSLHVGQAYDLHWTCLSKTPSEAEYLSMIDSKTSALFRMGGRLLKLDASKNRYIALESFLSLLGRYFQIRDDYLNIVSAEYAKKKGICEDLDEGKFSLPLIHALSDSPDPQLESVLRRRTPHSSLTPELKDLVLAKLEAKGSLEYTRTVLKELEDSIKLKLVEVEIVTGQKNWIFWHLLLQLEV